MSGAAIRRDTASADRRLDQRIPYSYQISIAFSSSGIGSLAEEPWPSGRRLSTTDVGKIIFVTYGVRPADKMNPNGPSGNYVCNIGGGFTYPPPFTPVAKKAKPFPSETFNAGAERSFLFYLPTGDSFPLDAGIER